MSMLKSHSLTLTLSHYLILSMSHSDTLTLSLSHSLTHNMLNNCCLYVYAQKSLSHSHTLTLSLSHYLTLSFTLCRHAEQLLSSCLCSKVSVNSFKLQCFFLDHSRCNTLSCYIRVHRAGSQLKISISG